KTSSQTVPTPCTAVSSASTSSVSSPTPTNPSPLPPSTPNRPTPPPFRFSAPSTTSSTWARSSVRPVASMPPPLPTPFFLPQTPSLKKENTMTLTWSRQSRQN